MKHHDIDMGKADDLAATVLRPFEMISMTEAEKILGFTRWQLLTTFSDGDLILLRHEGRIQLPRFQFDEKRGRILPALRPILTDLPDSWSFVRLLDWLATPHEAMGGDRPMDHLAANGARLAVVSLFYREVATPL